MTETYTTEDFVRALNGATLSAYSPGTHAYSASESAGNPEFERFRDLASKLVNVPKTEVSED
jgi:hypothetical protein